MAEMCLGPGVFFDASKSEVSFCPACGLKAQRRDVNAGNVHAWLTGVDFALALAGYSLPPGDRRKDAEEFMRDWTEGSKAAHGYPWEVDES